jgi:choline/glycine/proline betaine transport protein
MTATPEIPKSQAVTPESPTKPADAPPPPTPPPGGSLIPYPRVFFPAAGLLVLFVAATAIWPGWMGEQINKANTNVVQELGWYYIAIVAGFVFFSIWIAASHMGNVVLGRDDEEPEFSMLSWFAMLFAAGMGIGLVFWGVAEPLNHFSAPPPGLPAATPADAASTAINVTYLHWGLHAWAIYVVVGLAVAYSVHRRGNPISIRWALEPLLGDRIKGFWGDAIDVIAVLGTLFGVATSLGLGVSQISAGLSYLNVIDSPSTALKVVLIIVITGIALTSVVTGIDKGIKWLSNTNMVLAAALVIFVLAVGPTVFILSDFIGQIGSYVQNFFRLSFNSMAFEEDGKQWLGGWTTFYWGWWISWAPFVGVFIARISKGRTVREFITGVLLVPTLVTFLWFAAMGGTALHNEVMGEGGLIGGEGVDSNTALFQMLDLLPFAAITSGLAILLIVIFFVTSSDSGSYVVDMLSSGGNPNPPVWSRAFWAAMEGAVAAVLLIAGTRATDTDPLSVLQTMAILLAFPFSFVMIGMCLATAKALLGEERSRQRRQRKWLAEEVAKEIEEQNQHTT